MKSLNCGVYQIRNTITGDCYIGGSRNLRQRRPQHWTYLRAGTSSSYLLQEAYDQYSESAFEFVVLLYCDPEMVHYYEQRCIDSLNSAYNYNMLARGMSVRGFYREVDAREELRKLQIKKWRETR